MKMTEEYKKQRVEIYEQAERLLRQADDNVQAAGNLFGQLCAMANCADNADHFLKAHRNKDRIWKAIGPIQWAMHFDYFQDHERAAWKWRD